MITQEILKQYVTYHPDTGWFTSKGAKYCNRKAGSRVGSLHATKGYRYISVKGKTYREQRVAFLYMTGEWPKHQVDHINNVKDDNRWENLRDVTPALNSQNRGMWKTNTSGHTGVCWNKAMQKWQVNCRANGKGYYGGCFKDKEEAVETAKRIYSEIR